MRTRQDARACVRVRSRVRVRDWHRVEFPVLGVGVLDGEQDDKAVVAERLVLLKAELVHVRVHDLRDRSARVGDG